MATGIVGQLALQVKADLTQFRKDVQKEADTTGTTFATVMRGKLSGQVVKTIGVSLAAGFAGASKMAMEMEDRMAAFRAETGASAEEAEHFADSINAVSGRSLLSMDAIAASATKIRTDLGLTGEAADVALDAFARYERATNQGADAVLAFDDILDAWNLDATASTGIMDMLIKSHQLYGGSITDNQKLLSSLAPALQAVNMSLEEGQGLLNLFARAGVSGDAAITAFNKAIGSVESPDELRALLENISAMEDPFERAQAAAELFGTRAGTKLAHALSDANGDLGRFIVTVDEAAGATTEAANALDSTFSAKIKLAVNQALSVIRGFATDAGPALMGAFAALNLAQAFGLDKVIGPLFTKAGGAAASAFALAFKASSALMTSLTSVWTAVGATGSKALTAAAGAGGAAAAAYLGAIAKGITVVGIAAIAGAALDQGLQEAGFQSSAEGWAELFDPQGGQKLLEKAMAMHAETAAEGAAATAEAANEELLKGVIDGEAILARYRASIPAPDPDVEGTEDAFREMRQAILAGFGSIKSALKKENRPQLISADERLENMQGRMKRVMRQLRAAVAEGDPINIKYWTAAANKQRAQIERMRSKSVTSMEDIREEIDEVGDSLAGLPTETTPKVDVNVTGEQAVDNLQSDLDTLAGTYTATVKIRGTGIRHMQHGGQVTAGTPYIVGERRPELFVPHVSGRIEPTVTTGPSATTVNLQTYGLPMRARTPAEVVSQVRRAARMGLVEPPSQREVWKRTEAWRRT